jgi:iron complex transport system substrate-binding protein
VGVTENCDYPEDAKKIEKVGKDKLDIKKLLKLKPDLVIVLIDEKLFNLEALRKLKYTTMLSTETSSTLEVFAVDPKSLSDIKEYFRTIGTITNREHAAYSLLQRFNRRLDWVEARAKKEKRLKALMITSKRPVIAAGEGSYLNDILTTAGFTSVAPKGKDLFIKMDRKEIEKAAPDIVITSTKVAGNPKDIYGNRNFRKTSAGENKKAVCIEKDILLRPGPRLAQAVENMAEYAYGWPARGKEVEGENEESKQ